MTEYTNMFSELQLTEEDAGPYGELMLTFPQELLQDLGWYPGDIIEFRSNDDGSFQMLNKSK